MPRILSLSGKARHGKDFVAGLIVKMAKEEYGTTLGRYSFAWPLKARVYGEAYFKFSLEDVLYNKPEGIRTLLQQVGTEKGRLVFGEEFWMLQAEAMLALMAEANPDVKGWVISDCRFPNEVEFIRLGGKPATPIRAGIEQIVLNELDYTAEREAHLLENNPGALLLLDQQFQTRYDELLKETLANGSGIALWIDSDRPTLTGKAAEHPSETALDVLDKDQDFNGRLRNYTTTSIEDLREQVRPYVEKLVQ